MPEPQLSSNADIASLREIAGRPNDFKPTIITPTIPIIEPLSNHRLSDFQIGLNSYKSIFDNPFDNRYDIHRRLAEEIKRTHHLSHINSKPVKTSSVTFNIENLKKKLPGSTNEDLGIYFRHIMNTYYLPLLPGEITVYYSIRRQQSNILLDVRSVLKNGDILAFTKFITLIHYKLSDWVADDMHPDQNLNLTIYACRPLFSSPQSHYFQLPIEFLKDPQVVKEWIKNYPEKARKINPSVRIYIYEDRVNSREKYIDFYQEPSGKRKCFDLLCRLLSDYIRKKISTSGGKTIRRRVRHRQTIKKRTRR